MKKFLFNIHEMVWWFVSEVEDWLYPYRDREVTKPLWAEDYENVDIDDASYLKSQITANNDRIERLQNEMIYVTSQINGINTQLNNLNNPKQSDEGQEGSKIIVEEGEKTS